MSSWMPATGAERVMWLVILVVVSGFLAGQWLNRQRSKRLGEWLQAGLGSLRRQSCLALDQVGALRAQK